MDANTQTVVDAAMKLPVHERAKVVQELIDSLTPDVTAQIDDAWAAELDRRYAEFCRDESQGVAWSALKG